MFDVGFYEVIIIFIVGVLLFNPSDFYKLLNSLIKIVAKIKKYFYKNFQPYYKLLENEKNSVNVNEMEEKINNEFRNEYKAIFIEKWDLKINYKKNNNKKPKNKFINKNKKYVSRSKY